MISHNKQLQSVLVIWVLQINFFKWIVWICISPQTVNPIFSHHRYLSVCICLVLSQCGTIDYGSYVNLTERNLQDAQKFILMHEVVQPVVPVPYFMEDNVRFSHVAVDVVQGKDMLYHIIYLATGIVPHHVCIERKRRSVSSINM